VTTIASFTYDALPGRIRFGRGLASSAIAEELQRLDAQRVLVLTEASRGDVAERLTHAVSERIIGVFDHVAPHVPDDIAAAARERAADDHADVLLSIGGGSSTGTAKAIALTAGLPIVAVPTTFSGSEVTPVWGITTRGVKRTGRAMNVLPGSVIYDPELVESLPSPIAVASAFNALAHCVESLWAQKANPVISAVALEGVRVLAQGLRGYVRSDPESVDTLLYGSYLAGASFAVVGSGLHHKICHALGGAFDLPHAETHAVVLPHVLEYNQDFSSDLMARLKVALNDPGEDLTAPEALDQIRRATGAPGSLAEIGLTLDQRDEAVAAVSQILPVSNPRPVDVRGITAILDHAFESTP